MEWRKSAPLPARGFCVPPAGLRIALAREAPPGGLLHSSSSISFE